ncbi:organic cation transporter protein isoform X2 [Leptinotarsa decemlineata]|uniref:organic cation transporter protein isoform X2 n=1 Tax=Leptinotarsa decemlineata TaxID=7539 RepID=UPI003D30B2AD
MEFNIFVIAPSARERDDNSCQEPPQYKIDPIEMTIGNFGRWQLRISILMALLKLSVAWCTLSIVFMAPPTQFWCTPPDKYKNMSEKQWLAVSKPKDPHSHKQEGMNSGYCEMIDLENDPTGTIPCEFGYSYNKTVFSRTIVSEWDLICGHERLIDLTQVTLMLGVLIGNIVFGVMADKKGRKKVLITCIWMQSLLAVLASFWPWFWGFVLIRFFLGIANGGTMVTSFVLCMEVVGGKWRTIVPILYQIPFGFGNSIMSGLAYLLRDWREFHLALSFLISTFIVYTWCLPESPRWLLVLGRKEEAIEVLKKAATENKIDDETFQIALTGLSNVDPTDNETPCLSALFSTRQLKKRSFLLYLNWTICGITFYAFSQYLGHVGSNIFLTVGVSGFIALPGTVLCVVLVGTFGRRWTICSAYLTCAVCFLAIIFMPKNVFIHDWPRVILAAVGIVGMSISMPALYLFTSELYPTILRNAGVGVCIMFSRIGSMLAPLVIALEDIGPSVPLIILTIAALAEALLILLLPETAGSILPETVKDLDRQTDKDFGGYITVPSKSSEENGSP